MQLLNKESDVHAKARSEAVEALQLSEQLCQQAQKEIIQRDWDLKNTSAVNESRFLCQAAYRYYFVFKFSVTEIICLFFFFLCRIKELEEQVTQMKAKYKKEDEFNNRK